MRAFCLVALALLAAPAAAAAETVDQVAVRYQLAGEVLVGRGDKVLSDHGYGTVKPTGGARHKPGARWRLASITKQVTAALVIQQIGATAELDAPLMAPMLAAATLRQLLTHHSGLANPDSTPTIDGAAPAFYRRAKPDMAYCLSKRAVPGSEFAYNNCDYLIAGETLFPSPRWPVGMAMARSGELGVPGFVGGKPEPRFELASWGAAGGLMGTARAVFDFDRALMTGKLLSPTALAELWKPEGKGSYQALGQWVFPGTLKGCAAPKRIVQRDGEIYGVQARNFILPDDDLVVIVFTNRGSDDFPLGEVWEGKGFVHDLLSAVACP